MSIDWGVGKVGWILFGESQHVSPLEIYTINYVCDFCHGKWPSCVYDNLLKTQFVFNCVCLILRNSDTLKPCDLT